MRFSKSASGPKRSKKGNRQGIKQEKGSSSGGQRCKKRLSPWPESSVLIPVHGFRGPEKGFKGGGGASEGLGGGKGRAGRSRNVILKGP